MDQADYFDMKYLDYMYNISADPSESNDLKHSKPALFEELSRIFDQYLDTMQPTAYCGATDNKAAHAVFNLTQFISPWVNDTDWKCPSGEESEDESEGRGGQSHGASERDEIYCLYGLLPKSRCDEIGVPSL